MDSLDRFDIRTCVVGHVTDLFDTMLSLPVEHVDGISQSYLYGPRILASVSMAGEAMGVVSIQVGADLALQMAAAMMGETPEDMTDSEAVHDVIAEISNMIGGNLKSDLDNAGMPCELSPPVITTGKDYRSETAPMARSEYLSLYCGEHPILVYVGLKPDDALPSPVGQSSSTPPSGKVPADGALADFDLDASITGTLPEVFDTMLEMPVAVDPDPDADASGGGNRMLVSVSLSGTVSGWVSFAAPSAFAREMTAAMLGMESEEIESEEEIKDVLGEICNMIGGNLKSDLDNADLGCRLTPPAFTTGSDFTIELVHMQRHEKYCFRHGETRVWVEAGLKLD